MIATWTVETGVVPTETRKQQTERLIRDLVVSGEAGDQLPGEVDLAKRLSTSGVTVREALTKLWHSGLVLRRWGAGTFIAPAPQSPHPASIYVGLDPIGSLPRLLIDADCRVSLTHFAISSGQWPQWLNVDPGSPPVRVERCFAINDVPAILLHDYLPTIINARPGPDPESLADIEHDLPGMYLDYGIRIVKEEATLHGVVLAGSLADQLGIPAGSAVLHGQQTAQSDAGDIVVVTDAYYRTDVFTTKIVRVAQ